MSASANFTINGDATPPEIAVSAASTVTLALLSVSGANTIEWSVLGTNDPDVAEPTITPAGSPSGATATFVMPTPTTDGCAILVQCLVNGGIGIDGKVDATLTKTALVGVVNAAGFLPFAINETYERDATHGWAPSLNAQITEATAGGGGGGSGSGGGDGFAFTFSTTTTDADPGSGVLRFNNATVASVTFLYVDLSDNSSNNITGWLDALDDLTGSPKGRLHVQSLSDPTKWAVFKFTGVTTATGYRKLAVTHIASSGALPTTTAGDTFLSFDAGQDDPDLTPYTKIDGSRAFTGDQSFGTHKATGLGAPTPGSSDASTALYAETVAASAATAAALAVATTADEATLHESSGVYSVKTNGIGNTELRQGTACAVIGRSANSTGNVADIAASANGQVFKRTGNALVFAALDIQADVTNFGMPGQRFRVNAAGTAIEPYTDGGVVALTGAANTLVLGHAEQYLTVAHTSESDLTVPPNSAVPFPIGTLITGIQYGAGQLVFVEGAGVVIRSSQTKKCLQQFSAWSLKKIGTDEWHLSGELEAA